MAEDRRDQSRNPYWKGPRKSFGDRKVLSTNKMRATDIHGTQMLFPMEPLKIIGGLTTVKSKTSDFQNLQ